MWLGFNFTHLEELRQQFDRKAACLVLTCWVCDAEVQLGDSLTAFSCKGSYCHLYCTEVRHTSVNKSVLTLNGIFRPQIAIVRVNIPSVHSPFRLN